MKYHPSSHPPGFISALSLGCLGYLVIIALLWGGGQGVYTALKNRRPLEITVEEYLVKKPDAEWVTLKGAHLNLLEAAHKTRLGKVTEIFIPVRAKDEKEGAPVHVLLSTKDDEIKSALQDMEKSGDTLKGAIEAASRHADKLFITKDVSGLMRFGINSDDKTRDKLAKLNMNLAPNFVILNEGEKPELFVSFGMLAGGVMLGFIMLRSGGKTAAAPPPIPPPNLPPKL